MFALCPSESHTNEPMRILVLSVDSHISAGNPRSLESVNVRTRPGMSNTPIKKVKCFASTGHLGNLWHRWQGEWKNGDERPLNKRVYDAIWQTVSPHREMEADLGRLFGRKPPHICRHKRVLLQRGVNKRIWNYCNHFTIQADRVSAT